MNYKGYTIEKTGNEWFPYNVNLRGEREYSAVTLGQAKKWVDAYRQGVTWAVLEKLEQDKTRKALTA
jgi:hypothetical protein